MLGGFTPMVDSAQSKNKRILQVAAEGLMKKNVVPESCSKFVFIEMRLQNNFIFVVYGQPCQ
jgi:hypothetical protein